MLSGAAVADMLPHAGNMVLIERVEEWDDERIVCSTGSHRSADNPLARSGRLASICAIEYGAQAIALHAALNGNGTVREGRLAAVRNVALHTQWLDLLETPLFILARRQMTGSGNSIYDFALSAGEKTVASGRATVVRA